MFRTLSTFDRVTWKDGTRGIVIDASSQVFYVQWEDGATTVHRQRDRRISATKLRTSR